MIGAARRVLDLWSLLGPGMLYAGAAVGVSHLVQSTRAGSDFGWSLWWIVILANVIKYPFFEFGPRCVAATGECLLYGYKKLGRLSLVIYILMTLLTMFAVQTAVTIVTAGLIENIFHFNLSAPVWSSILLIVCGVILVFDSYQFLNNIVKYIILILTVATLVSVIVAQAPENPVISHAPFSWENKTNILFLVALMGWMPAPVDLSVWHSGWSQAHDEVKQTRTSLKNQMLDFNVGYIGTALLALAFLGLGAIVMHSSGKVFPTDAVGFTKELIMLFTQSLGSWSYPIILAAAFCTMLSTTLTLLDAFPRTLRRSFHLLLGTPSTNQSYAFWLVIVIAGSSSLLLFFIGNMKVMVDLATTISFVVAPILAFLNMRVVFHQSFPQDFAPPAWLKIHSYVGLLFLSLFSLYFLWVRFIN